MDRGTRRGSRSGRLGLALSGCVAIAAAMTVTGAVGAATERPAHVSPSATGSVYAASDWWGGTYRTDAGDVVRVYVSDYYPQDEARARHWVGFLSRLVHGPELADLTLYVAPEAVVRRMCGEGSLGCYFYGDESIVVIGDEVELPDPLTVEQVLGHEYGHHVANNRANPPWEAVMRGTKRWASFVNVCARMRDGVIGQRYDRDPGELFAETYRILVDRRRGVAFSWPLVDRDLRPGVEALALVRKDVLEPWRQTTLRIRGRLPVGRVAQYVVATPYDGELEARVRSGRGAVARVSLVDAASGEARSRPGTRASTTVCGQRRVRVLVHMTSGGGAFTLVLTRP